MKLNELRPAEGSSKAAWRKGRGAGSGNGKTAGKGHKGQNARSGGGVRPGFEGGQLPLYRKLPNQKTDGKGCQVHGSGEGEDYGGRWTGRGGINDVSDLKKRMENSRA